MLSTVLKAQQKKPEHKQPKRQLQPLPTPLKRVKRLPHKQLLRVKPPLRKLPEIVTLQLLKQSSPVISKLH